MTTCIQLDSGPVYYTYGLPEEVKRAIDQDEFLDIWWFSLAGNRYQERCWFNPTYIQLIRSESDDG